MIIAVDAGDDRRSYGFELVINSLKAKYSGLVNYVSNDDLHRISKSEYQIVLVSFMFVENYLHISRLFSKLKLELYAADRDKIVIAGGGPISENPEPVAQFFDICVIGEGEWAIRDIVDTILRHNGDKKSALEEIYHTVDCAYIPSMPKHTVNIRHESPTRATTEIAGIYTRECKELRAASRTKNLEYSVEYHRSCKRKCTFCSYSHLQGKYRETEKEVYFRKLDELALSDKRDGNKIVSIQTNLFHFSTEAIDYLQTLNKMPNYSSACMADCFTKHGQEILSRFQKSSIYLRFGVEDFTESGRKALKKPISDMMLANIPNLFPTKGRKIKMFFITHLPGQTVDDIRHFESVLNEMSKRAAHYYTVDLFFTVLNYKLSTPISLQNKQYSEDIAEYINHTFRRRYGKITVHAFKNQSRDAWEETNILSLADQRLTPVLAGIKRYRREDFLAAAREVIDFDEIFCEYGPDKLPNWFIDYGD